MVRISGEKLFWINLVRKLEIKKSPISFISALTMNGIPTGLRQQSKIGLVFYEYINGCRTVIS